MRTGGRARVEVALLGALAAVPLLAYLVYLGGHPVERFAIGGDYARLELDVRHVGSGTLLGAYSRFQFSHPGPLWFFLAAPVYALAGRTSTGLYAAACAINALCVAATVAGVRALASGAHAIATLIVVVAWLGAFGDVCALPWNPLTVALPLLTFLVYATLFARGASIAAPIGAFFGVLAVQTHLATTPVVIGIALAVTAKFFHDRRSEGLERGARRHLVFALSIVIVLFLPPILEALLARDGNLGRIAHFFLNRPEPAKPLALAFHDWAFATSSLPDRLFDAEIAKDGFEPAPMGSVGVPSELTRVGLRTVGISIGAFVAAAIVAFRRREHTSFAFVVVGAGACVLAIAALTRIVGPDLQYLVFWTTAATTVAWIGVACTVATAIHAKYTEGRGGPAARTLAIVVALAATLASAALQRPWLAKDLLAPKPREHWRAAYAKVHRRIVAEHWTPVVHTTGAWNLGLALLLELEKDAIAPRVVDRDRWLAGRQLQGPNGAPNPVHLWITDAESPLEITRCLTLVAEEADVKIWSSSDDVRSCD